MRKITRQLWGALLISALLFFPSVANATTVYSINENFSTTPATNWGFSTVSGQTFTYDAVNKLLQVRPGSPSSYSVKTFATAITQGTDNKITVQLVLKLYTNGNSTSGVSFYFRDSNGKALFGLGIYQIWLGLSGLLK